MKSILKVINLIIIASVSIEAQVDGTLDALFGTNGQVQSSYGVSSFQSAEGAACAIQADGKIVITGDIHISGTYYMPVARFNTDGTVDTTFGTNGANVSVSQAVGKAIAIQPDGKIIVCGYTNPGIQIILRRFNSNGSLDTSFNMTPSVTVNGGNIYIALQQDGKIVAASSHNNNAVLVRYNVDGSLDTTFPQVSTTFGFADAYFNGVFLQNDGKIVVVGGVDGPGDKMLAARYLPNGSLDGSFGTLPGYTIIDITGGDFGYAGLLQPDGKIVVIGMINDDINLGFVRLTAQGLFDDSFGAAGVVATSLGSFAPAAALQSDGKLILAGSVSADGSNYFLGATRYTANGVLDTSFGKNGYALSTVGGNEFNAVAIDAQGSIIGVGTEGAVVEINKFTVDSLHYSALSQAVWQRYYNQLN